MWPVKQKWKNHIFLSSEHIYVYELLKWHGKLNTSTLQMLLNCSSGFKAKALGKKSVPEKSRSWMKVCVSKMYSMLQAKWSQSKAFIFALLDGESDILHTLPSGHRDTFWAYPGANKHGYLLKQLRNVQMKTSISRDCISETSGRSLQTASKSFDVVTCKTFYPCTSLLHLNSTDSCYSLQYGGTGKCVQIYTFKQDPKIRYSNVDIMKILENPDMRKVSCETPIKPKGGEVYVLNWFDAKHRVKDYVADQYAWVADTTESLSLKDYPGITIVKKYFNIHDDNGIVALKKTPHSKEFQKTVTYIKDNPYLQVIEYIGNETVYKPRPHGNSKEKSSNIEYCRTAPSVMTEIQNKLNSGASVSGTYKEMVTKCNTSSVQGVLNPRN